MENPMFSIVLAIYNTSDYLSKCLDSLVSQTISKELFEIILVNDCSTDCSLDIIQQYLTNNDSIKLINKEKNEGTFLARIDGLRIASGNYIIVVDPDDWLSRTMLENLLKTVQETPADMIEIGHYIENGQNSVKVKDELYGYYKVEHLLKRFTERLTISALWRRVYSRKTVYKCLMIVDKYFNRKDYIGLCVEDEFIFPILLNSADSYFVSKDCYYHYRDFREGSSMSSISLNPEKKLLHALLTVQAADKILNIYRYENKKSMFYFYMQTNNLFYYLGQIIIQNKKEELSIYRSALLKHKIYFRKFHKNILCAGVRYNCKQLLRYFHLIIKSKFINC